MQVVSVEQTVPAEGAGRQTPGKSPIQTDRIDQNNPVIEDWQRKIRNNKIEEDWDQEDKQMDSEQEDPADVADNRRPQIKIKIENSYVTSNGFNKTKQYERENQAVELEPKILMRPKKLDKQSD